MARIAIIGAAGYVGMELVRQLQSRNHEIIAVARSNGKFLLEDFRCKIIHPSEVRLQQEVDVVVNLAYPTNVSAYLYPYRNREILALLEKFTGKHTHIIHVSTLAVFGLLLEHDIAAQRVFKRRDFPYIESKIELENLLINKYGTQQVDIVRLGNVWGPGSSIWTAPLISKLLFGEAVGISGYGGFCNATDIANVVSYLTFLVESPSRIGCNFYHLAELSEVKWSYWIDKICNLLHVQPWYEQSMPGYPEGFFPEIKDTLVFVKPIVLLKKIASYKIIGSLGRSLIRLFPEQVFNSIKRMNAASLKNSIEITDSQATFLMLMSCQKQFKSVVNPAWLPVVSVKESWERVERWMSEVGYT